MKTHPLQMLLADRWQKARQAYAARSPRERALVSICLGVLLLLAVDHIWTGPAWQAWQQSRNQLNVALASRQALISDAEQTEQRQAQLAGQLEAEWRTLRARTSSAATGMDTATPELVAAADMLPLLEQLLAKEQGLQLRSLQSQGQVVLGARGQAGPTGGATAAGSTGGPTVYRHGVELVLEGSYADLVAYLQAIEEAPRKVLWGAMQLKVLQHPKLLLTLHVYTMSLDPGWVEI